MEIAFHALQIKRELQEVEKRNERFCDRQRTISYENRLKLQIKSIRVKPTAMKLHSADQWREIKFNCWKTVEQIQRG